MKKVGFLAAAVAVGLAIVVIGCGGGGGGTGTSTSTTSGTTGTTGSTYQLAAINSGGNIVDPQNLVPGQTVTFEVVSIDPVTLAVTKAAGATFNTNDSSGSAGTLNHFTGAYTAKASSNGAIYTLTAFASGQNYQAYYSVTPSQAVLTGTIDDSNGVPIPFAKAVFYDASGNQVGSSFAGLDGVFTASLPASAVRFNIDGSSLPNSPDGTRVPSQAYYKVFTYGTGSYSATAGSACAAPLPALANGQTSSLTGAVVVDSQYTLSGVVNIPPPPPGCTP